MRQNNLSKKTRIASSMKVEESVDAGVESNDILSNMSKNNLSEKAQIASSNFKVTEEFDDVGVESSDILSNMSKNNLSEKAQIASSNFKVTEDFDDVSNYVGNGFDDFGRFKPELPVKANEKKVASVESSVKWDPTVPLEYYVSRAPDSFVKMVSAGFPKHVAHKIMVARENNITLSVNSRQVRNKRIVQQEQKQFAATNKEEREFNSITHSKKELFHNSFDVGEVAKFWRLSCDMFCPRIPKPSKFEHNKFMTWVNGEVWYLQTQIKSKKQYVTGNEICRLLYYNRVSNIQSNTTQSLLLSSVFIEEFGDDKGFTPLPNMLSNYVDWSSVKVAPSLQIRGLHIKSVKDLELLSPLFKRHKPLYTKSLAYLNGDVSVDPNRLQSELVKIFPIQLQGGSWSSFSVKHDVTVNVPIFNEIRQSIGGLAEGLTDQMLSVVALVVAVSKSSDWLGVCACITLYVQGNRFVQSIILDKIAAVQKKLISYQGEASSLWESMKHGVGDIYQLIVSTLAAFFIDSLGSVKEILKPLLETLVFSTKRALTKESGIVLAKSLTTWFFDIVNKIRMCIDSRTLYPLWGPKWNPEMWIREAEAQKNYFSILTIQAACNPQALSELERLRKEGVIGQDWVSPLPLDQYLAKMNEHIVHGAELEKYFHAMPLVTSKLYSVRKMLQAFYDSLQSTSIGMCQRVAPFGIFMDGKPGTGKTVLSRTIIKAIGNLNGFLTDASAIYDFQTGVNFQDGLTQTQWAVVMDDVDQSPAPLAAGVKTYVEEVIALGNNKPYAVESAAVELKGKIRANPLVMMFLSNFKKAQVDNKTFEPQAFFRRFAIYVTVTVKEEFSLPDGRLDPQKALRQESIDMYWLYVSSYSAKSSNYRSKPVRMDFPTFLQLVQKSFKEHLLFQQQLVKPTQNLGFCKKCGLEEKFQCEHVRVPVMDLSGLISQAEQCEVKQQVELQGLPVGSLVVSTALVGGAIAVHQLANEVRKNLANGGFGSTANTVKWWQLEFKRKEQAMVVSLAAAFSVVGVKWALIERIYPALYNNLFVEHQSMVRDKGVSVVNDKSWDRVLLDVKPGLPPVMNATWTKDELVNSIKQNMFYIGSETGPSAKCVAISHNCVIVPTHLVKDKKDVVCCSMKGVKVTVDPLEGINLSVLPSNPEIAILRISNLSGATGILTRIPMDIDVSVCEFDEVEIVSDDVIYSGQPNKVLLYGRNRILTTGHQTKLGDCGAIYISRNRNNWFASAIHFALDHGFHVTPRSMGAMISRIELERVAVSMNVSLQGLTIVPNTFCKIPSDMRVGNMNPVKSELMAVQAHQGVRLEFFGQLSPPISGSTLKSKVTKSLLYDSLQEIDYEKSVCGKPNYWCIPAFRGKMIDGVWNSPWTNAFKVWNTCKVDERCFILAVCDYLQDIQTLRNTDYKVLSEQEVILGIPGTFVKSINLATSVGPPYNGSKSRFIARDEVCSELDPKISSILDAINEILEESIPSVIGVCTLKDEPIKEGKVPRVFVNLPSSYNMILKQNGSCWKSFIRSHPTFFESMVGVNMTSNESSRILDILKSIDPSMTNLYEGDVTMMDKAWNGYLFDYVALVVYAITYFIGCDYRKAERLVLSLKHITYSIKNDLFRAFWNPSGNDETVEINGLGISLGERYVYYRTHPFRGDWEKVYTWWRTFRNDPLPPKINELNFRQHVALVTYGDDSVKATLLPLHPEYQNIWRQEIGMEMQDADKNKEILKRNVLEISFLKRNFRFDEELGYYLPCLSEKSMARTLLMKKESILSNRDHAATVISEHLRECVYYGRSYYARRYAIMSWLVSEHDLFANSYLEMKSFDFWVGKMKEGDFQTWSTRPFFRPDVIDVGDQLVQTGILLQSKEGDTNLKMSDVNLAKSAESADNIDLTQYTQTHQTGTIVVPSVEMSRSNESPVFMQQMPINNLDDFMLRDTFITAFQLSTADTEQTELLNFDPWDLFVNNAAIASKLANYSYIRGTIQVIAIPTVPPGCYGRYVLSAVPTVGNDDISPYFQMCVQTDHYAELDMAESNAVVLQLPWVSSTDFKDISDLAGMWVVRLFCLVSAQPGSNSGISTAQVKVYANLLDDYVLSVPHFQGKLKYNKTMEKMAPKAAAKASGKPSAHLSAISKAASMVKEVPVIGSMASAVEFGASAASQLLSALGFTREPKPRAPMPITFRSVTNVARFDGDESTDAAALSMYNQISIDATLNGFSKADCLSLDDLFDRWTIVGAFDWDTTDVSLDTLYTLPVTPFYGMETATDTVALCPAGYVGLPFTYWRGDMMYKIVIPVSKFHRGQLQVAWVPKSSTPSGDITNITLNTIIDVTNGDTEILVGFARERPVLHNTIIIERQSHGELNSANGELHFRVINPLIAQVALANTRVYVYAKAMPNMRFGVPRDLIPCIPSTGVSRIVNLRENIQLQGAFGDEPSEDRAIVVVPASGDYPGDKLLFGEEVLSVRALLQKPSNLGSISLASGVNAIIPTQFVAPGSTQTSDFNAPWSWQGYFKSLFVGIACSERYQLIVGANTFAGAFRAFSPGAGSSLNSIIGTMAPLTYCGSNQGAEFLIPYYNDVKFVSCSDSVSKNASGPVTVLVARKTGAATSIILVFYSFGPDIRATCFRHVPQVKFATGTNPNGAKPDFLP